MKSFVIILEDHPTSESFGNVALSSGIEYGWNVEKFKAVDGRYTNLDNYKIFPTQQKGKCKNAFLRPGVVGCFLSHYRLWKMCVELNETIGIFEQDIEFKKINNNTIAFADVLRFDKPEKIGKDYGTGVWWEGAHAYLLTPAGAKKLLDWTHRHGAYPADVMLGTGVVDIQFNLDNLIFLNMQSRKFSLTSQKTF
jgi:GR25 family glycosyltransferase involved in LPS biosynthesis